MSSKPANSEGLRCVVEFWTPESDRRGRWRIWGCRKTGEITARIVEDTSEALSRSRILFLGGGAKLDIGQCNTDWNTDVYCWFYLLYLWLSVLFRGFFQLCYNLRAGSLSSIRCTGWQSLIQICSFWSGLMKRSFCILGSGGRNFCWWKPFQSSGTNRMERACLIRRQVTLGTYPFVKE